VSSHSAVNDADRRGIPGGGRRESWGTVSRTLPVSDGTIRLEQLGARHLDGLADLGRDPDVQRFTYVPTPWEEGFERTWLEGYEQAPVGTRAAFAVVEEASGEFVGFAALVRIDQAAREAEAGCTSSHRTPEAAGSRRVRCVC
jgi:RimJ/RimL family protein N-acetyltransferase